MAKRLSDLGKWQNAWFRELPPKAKLIWIYLIEQCDIAGVWDVDFKLASFQIGEAITQEDLDVYFPDRIIPLDESHILLKGFAKEQYGTFKEGSKTYIGVNNSISRFGVSLDTLGMQYVRSIHTPSENKMDHTYSPTTQHNTITLTTHQQHLEGGVGETKESYPQATTYRQQTDPDPKVPDENVQTALRTWQRTLDHFKSGRAPLQTERINIFRALQTWPLEEVCHALSGMRFEPANQSYDPSKHFNVMRIFKPDMRLKFINWSTQEMARRERKQQIHAVATTVIHT